MRREAVKRALALTLAALAAGSLLAASQPARLGATLRDASQRLALLRHGVKVQSEMVAMGDGVRLATDVYLPSVPAGGLPALLVRLPYGKATYGEALTWARTYAPLGYAVVLQDLRGRYGSEGEFAPYAHGAEDGAATLDWIARQPWSNGHVGTAGCSALGEVQVIQATTLNPHLDALIAEGAGGAIGSGGASRGYFGLFEGGVPNLAAAYGWFSSFGGKTSDQMGGSSADPAEIIGELPSGTLVSRHRADPTDYESFLARFEDATYWKGLGYVTATDRFATPALHVNSWHDIAVQGTFELAALMRANATTEAARAHQHVIVGPGLHCDFARPFAEGHVGDLPVDPRAALDLDAIYQAWLDHWLRGGPALHLAQYTYYVMGADRWAESDRWPPAAAREQRWRLGSGGRLSLGPEPLGEARIRYDPLDPTPSIGGPICCTGSLDLPAGPLDQRPNAGRDDVLFFASEPLAAPLMIVGDPRVEALVSSDAPDTDLVAVLLDVAPSGAMLAITQGALRLRYRERFDAPQLLGLGQVVEARVDLRPTAYEVPAGHRLGLHLSSASFPRLERNLNGPGPNHLATEPRLAITTIHFGGEAGSVLVLPVEG